MQKVIKLLADKQILLTEEQLPEPVLLTTFDPSEGIPADAGDYDALFVRTVSPIDRTTIPSHPKRLRFIGSATAGFDHVDQDWLAHSNIEFAYAPGSNANSVGEYVAVSILLWALKTGNDLSSLTAGIIGAGHTGTAVAKHLTKMNVRFKNYDPPRQIRETTFKSAGIEEILACDILTFHTPLTTAGEWPTKHWLSQTELKDRYFSLIINAARGGVIDEKALYSAFKKNGIQNYILDVWENEPFFDDQIAENAWLRTPHIAGYSVQSKQRAAAMLMESLSSSFGFEYTVGNRVEQSLKCLAGLSITDPNPDLSQILLSLHPLGEYDRMFKDLIGLKSDMKPRAFQKIRTGYPLRHEHPFYKLDPAILEKFPVLKALGFT